LALNPNNAKSSDADLVYHLVNPNSFSWKNDLLPALKKGCALPAFEVVSPQEWLNRLANSDSNPETNPSIKLLDFWKGKYENAPTLKTDDEEPAGLFFETDSTIRDCPSLGDVKDPVAAGLIQRYIEVWMKSWTRT
jgi:hypothetical protein